MRRKFSLGMVCLLLPLLAGFGWRQSDERKEPEEVRRATTVPLVSRVR